MKIGSGSGNVSIQSWERIELRFEAGNEYANPYTEVEIWVDLTGPQFSKRCYGFWDGGNAFCVRVTGFEPGIWEWQSGANRSDPGLCGKKGAFEVRPWTEEDLLENPNRRGMVCASANGHALQYQDGTPFFLLADTWWSVPTCRYRWYEDDIEREIGPEMGFKDMVRFRKNQGFNSIAILAAFPNWANDDYPAYTVSGEDGVVLRWAWGDPKTKDRAKDMHNEGGRAFFFPGKVPGFEDLFPDIDRINPEYFKHLDKKMDYLAEKGFVPFLEVLRRDASQPWKKYYEWPDSYARYVQYVIARYQAHNVIFSPIHFDYPGGSIHPQEYNAPANQVVERFGPPPFGNLMSANAGPSTLSHFGGPDQAKWLTMHQIGNKREHVYYWLLTEIFNAKPARPALHGEAYYSGLRLDRNNPDIDAEGNTAKDDLFNRSGMYGSVLSGGYAGFVYGADGLWGGDSDPQAAVRMHESILWSSATQVRHLGTFILSEGTRYRDLVPDSELVVPNKSYKTHAYEGWAYCSRTADKSLFLLYFERGCPAQATIRSAKQDGEYTLTWFDPRKGVWFGETTVFADEIELISDIQLPGIDQDWACKLKAVVK